MQSTTTPKDESPIHVSISRFSKGIGTVFAGVIEILQSLEPQAAHGLISTYLPREGTEHEHEATPTAHDASGIGDNRDHNGAVANTGAEDVKKAQGAADPASASPTAASSVPPSASIPAGRKTHSPSITPDDITKVIVAKLKQNRSNNTAIGAILRSYQVDKVSDLQPEQYPIIAVLMTQGKVTLDREVAALFSGINWTEMNQQYKRDYSAVVEHIIKERDYDSTPIHAAAEKVQGELQELNVMVKRGKLRPPKG